MGKKIYISMFSNSSRFRCLLRKAAARFFTRRASRLLKPDTSGGTKSLLATRSPTARFLVARGAGLAERLFPVEIAVSAVAGSVVVSVVASVGTGDSCLTSKSKTWWVGMHIGSDSGTLSGDGESEGGGDGAME